MRVVWRAGDVDAVVLHYGVLQEVQAERVRGRGVVVGVVFGGGGGVRAGVEDAGGWSVGVGGCGCGVIGNVAR